MRCYMNFFNRILSWNLKIEILRWLYGNIFFANDIIYENLFILLRTALKWLILRVEIL